MTKIRANLLTFTIVVGFISYSLTMFFDGLVRLDSATIATAILCLFWVYIAHLYKKEKRLAKEQQEKKHRYTYGMPIFIDTYLPPRVRKIQLSRKTIKELQSMDPFKFEDYIAAIYKKLGYSVEQTKKTGDGGKDIIIKKGGKTYFVECKRYQKPIDAHKMRDFIGACAIGGPNIKGIYVTTSSFTKDAEQAAKQQGIQLIYGEKLTDLIDSANF